LEDRAAFVDNHLDVVLDSARNPMGEKAWWREADEPWQCLAACIELDQALASPDPTKFVSHFPVQQDGSCNGLQHYAALGRDVQGAQKVNLSPSSSPQDIYAAVANLVNKKIDKDCETGHSLALKLKGKINRKIIKQPVMTNVYGVTPFGARAQIQERLKEFNVVPKENYVEARKYLCDEVFSSLRTLFVKARLIQDWLTTASMEIARALPADVAVKFGYKSETEVSSIIQGEKYRTPSALSDIESDASLRYPQTPVSWNTPLGFRVVQPYLKTRSIHLKTVMQTVSLRASNQFDPVDVNKQVSAFPPNFIHSLDATHMFMTAMACFEAGITFASVHDCFWTHPSMVDGMNRHIREQFVALYSQPILERLREDLLQNYGTYKIPIKVPSASVVPLPEDAKPTKTPSEKIDEAGRKTAFVSRWRHIYLPPIPEKGDFDITEVLGSQYFFS
jgi:DNA-directed RNA polymerase